MLQSILNKRVAYALGKAAAITGTPVSVFRPSGSSYPTQGTPYTSLYCAFDVAPDFKFVSTAKPDHAYVALLADPTLVRQGDYLIGDDVHFVGRIEPLRPALCVLCTQTIDFLETDVSTSAGTNAYGGRTAATDTAVALGWPVSMSPRFRSGTDITKLPSDTRSAFYEVLAPPIPGLTLTFGMRIRDAEQQEYEIISTDLSPFGWKLAVGLATT